MPSKASLELQRRRRRPGGAASAGSCLDRSRLEWDAPRTAERGALAGMRAFLCGTGDLAATGSPSDGVLPPPQERSLIRAQRRRPVVAWLALLAGVAAASPAAGSAASPRRGTAPSAVECQKLLGRAPVPPRGPAQAPSEKPLVDEVSEFVELTVPDDQRYVFPTDDERARFQCGFQYAAAGQLGRATRLLQPLQYDVKQLVDTGDRAGSRSSCSRSGSRGAGTGSSATGAPGGSTSSPRRRGCRCWRSRCRILASRARDATRSAATVERTRWR